MNIYTKFIAIIVKLHWRFTLSHKVKRPPHSTRFIVLHALDRNDARSVQLQVLYSKGLYTICTVLPYY